MTPGSLVIVKKWSCWYALYVLFLCPLAETTKTCRKREPVSFTLYRLICRQNNHFWILLQVYERAFSWPKKEKKSKKKLILWKGVSSLWCELVMQKLRANIFTLLNILYLSSGDCAARALGGAVEDWERGKFWMNGQPRQGKEKHISAWLC